MCVYFFKKMTGIWIKKKMSEDLTADYSNISKLSTNVQEYLKLVTEKKKVWEQGKKLDVEIRKLKQKVEEEMAEKKVDIIEISPSSDEVQIYGEKGKLKMRMDTQYEKMTRPVLLRNIEIFFKKMFENKPEMTSDEIKHVSAGMLECLWSNRQKTEKYVLQYVPNSKRKNETQSEQQQHHKRNRIPEHEPLSQDTFRHLLFPDEHEDDDDNDNDDSS